MPPNNDNLSSAPDDLVDQALEQLARSPAALAVWRAASAERDAAAQEALALWRDVGATAAAAEHRRSAGIARRPAVSARHVAVGLAATIVLALLFNRFIALPPPDYAAPAGERFEATLPDGSRVALNVGAELSLNFNGTERRVQVLQGEALFDVAVEPARPFVVAAGGVSAKAVGTVYAVRRLDDGAMVTVTRGIVDVAVGDGKPARLTAGQRATAAAPGPVKVNAVDAEAETAWRRGKLIFHSRPLAEVAAEMERYLPGRVVVADRALRRLSVTGVFDLGQTGGLVPALAEGLGLKVLQLPWLAVIY